jgi:integrase
MYLQNTGGLAKNTIGTHLKKIKQMLKEAHQAGLHSNTSYQAFQTMQEQVDAIYLTMDEIEAIYNLTDLPAYLERSRDRFLIGCYTGLRYADFSQIIPSNIDAEGYLRVRTRKTKALVVLPVHPNIYAILQRNGNQPPRSISNQKLNQHLKEIARLAEITQPVSTVRTEGGKRVERTRPKWQLVSTHTARRSFATNAYLAGIPVPAIMQITGHATYKSFLKYVRVDAERNARLLKDHSFFSQHGK